MTLERESADDTDVFDDDQFDSISLKYCFEGAETLVDLSGALRALADSVDERATDGWRLNSPVEGGWAHLVRDESQPGAAVYPSGP